MDAPIEYRLRWARAGIAVEVALVIGAVVMVVWRGDLLPFAVVICAFAWFIFLAWTYPMLKLDSDGVHVRNPFSARFVPYGLITDVTGGGRLQIELRGGVKVVATAISGNGVYLVNVMRKREAYGQYVVPVRRVDDLRLDAGEDDSVATRIAQIIRRQIALMPGADKLAEPPARRLNWFTISMSVGVVAAFVAAATIS